MNLVTRRTVPLMLGATLSAVAPAAFSQAFDAVRLFGAAPNTDGGSVGLAVITGREYAGSDERRTRVLPGLDYQWRNGWFAGTTNGIGFDFARRPDMNLGLRITADFGRDKSRSTALRGLGDVDPAPEVGAFFNYAPLRALTFTSSLRYGSGNDNKGMVLDLGAVHSARLGEAWRLGAGVAASYVNREYMQDYFGITPAQSAASGYRVYRPDAGWRALRASLPLSYRPAPRVAVTAATSLSRLQGDAADSPLARKATTLNGVLVVSYAF